MASFNFNFMVHKALTGNINFGTDTFRMLLTTGTVLGETEKDTFDYRNDITTEHAATGGYATGGNVVALTVAAVDTVNNDIEITAAPVAWSSSTITATGAVIYKARGGASSADELVCYIDFGGTVSSTNGTFTVTPTGSIKFQN
jgi:hypothetical protein